MLQFGVAGFPLAFTRSAKKIDRSSIFPWLRSLGLNALELQMTYGPRTAVETCRLYRKLADAEGITITVHASYFIVLTSDDLDKVARSLDTLRRTFSLAEELGSSVVVLHPGPIYNDRAAAEATLIRNLTRFYESFDFASVGLFLETAGKRNQFGSVEEILRVTEQFTRCYPCVDFGHVHARTLGTLKTLDGVLSLCNTLLTSTRSGNNDRIHFHFTPIDYGPRGERVHKTIRDLVPSSEREAELFENSLSHLPCPGDIYYPRPEHVSRALRETGLTGILISETHDSQEEGAIALKNAYFEV